ncbi:hypothetical protein A0071_04595 [Campylobacter cuniculorum]|uniref:Uncharacterized protein n=1 Tax=Campylobacter cuniculorum TaxID=374106 RepID=A0ABX6TZT8_9BACT|nr:hypothetical protein [Campylobacter cuniculorum]QOR05215.1 hypothetical protein A0071_04595 [Campylobacter cuniculorum]
MVKNDGRDILLSGTGLNSTGFGTGQFISQGSVSLRESKGQIGKDMADAMGFGTARKENAVTLVFVDYLSQMLGVTAVSDTLGVTAATVLGTWCNINWTAVKGGYSGQLSKMLQDVMGFSSATRFEVTGNVASLGAAYLVSAGSGFSIGSGMSQFAKMREGGISAMNNGFNIKDETSGVTTLKGAMAVNHSFSSALFSIEYF